MPAVGVELFSSLDTLYFFFSLHSFAFSSSCEIALAQGVSVP